MNAPAKHAQPCWRCKVRRGVYQVADFVAFLLTTPQGLVHLVSIALCAAWVYQEWAL